MSALKEEVLSCNGSPGGICGYEQFITECWSCPGNGYAANKFSDRIATCPYTLTLQSPIALLGGAYSMGNYADGHCGVLHPAFANNCSHQGFIQWYGTGVGLVWEASRPKHSW